MELGKISVIKIEMRTLLCYISKYGEKRAVEGFIDMRLRVQTPNDKIRKSVNQKDCRISFLT